MKNLVFAALAFLLAATTPAFSHTPTFNNPLNGTQMALTDNTLTAEELKAAYAANPALKDVVLGSVKTDLGYTPYTQAEFDAALGTKIGEKTSEIYSALDKDVFEATGVVKPGDKKTYEYIKDVIGGLKSAPTALQTKITELEQQIARGSGDATLKAQLEALQAKEQQYQTDLEGLRTENFQKDVKLDVRDGLRELKFDPTVKESVRKVLVDNATHTIVAQAKVQENADGTKQIVYVQDGKTRLGADGKTPADAAYLLSEMLKDVLDTGHKGAGGGANADGNDTPGLDDAGNVQVPAQRPANVKTKTDVTTWLLGLGVKQGTEQFDKEWAKHTKDLTQFR